MDGDAEFYSLFLENGNVSREDVFSALEGVKNVECRGKLLEYAHGKFGF